MAEGKDLRHAWEAYQTLCSALNSHNWRYERDEGKLSIKCGVRGDDLPMELNIRVDADRQLVLLLSLLPFTVPENKRIELAVAICSVNDSMVDGCFDYDVKDGSIFFRITNSIRDSQIGMNAFSYLLFCACVTIDKYNDKFMMLSKGLISLDEFLSADNSK